jgi:hypothetical protein
MFRKSFFLVLISAFGLTACQSNPANNKPQTVKNDSTAKAVEVVKPDAKTGDYSYFIAGMDSLVNDPKLKASSATKGYRAYAKSMNDNFGKIEKDRLIPMRNWASAELNKNKESKVLFYPFSGPDILHATVFYPDADTYILMALELPGHFPDFEKMDSTATTEYLTAVNDALSDVFNKSYFITSKMSKKVSFSADGTTPIMCLFLARSGYQVLDIEKYQVTADGGQKQLPTDSSMAFNSNRYLLIHFKKPGTDAIKSLIYFSGNICDDSYPNTDKVGLKKNAALVAWIEKNTANCNTYLKSASYLMHGNNYSIIRNLILKNSKTVVQDDTGIAFRYFDKTKWNFNFYGSYVKPVKDFSAGAYQADLRDAYTADSTHVKKLDYSLGYHWQNKEGQNLMKAEKKE